MEKLYIKHRKKVAEVSVRYIRGFMGDIHWKDRFIGIKGARGVGKTTLLLQYIKQHFGMSEEALYASLDDLYFAGHRLVDFAEGFVQQGGKYLFLDEVHRYGDWSRELKNLYDDLPELHIVFTGSSMLDLVKAKADLSRRAVLYTMRGLSFREYLAMTGQLEHPKLTLQEILEGHVEISQRVTAKLKPLKAFRAYLTSGYYPFFLEYPETYQLRLEQVIDLVLERDIPAMKPLTLEGTKKLRQLLAVLASSVPFKPNISKLSERTGISRNSLVQYLHYLQEADILKLLFRDTKGIGQLQKPEKVFFANPNLAHAFADGPVEAGNERETFFLGQVGEKYTVSYTEKGDFLVDGKWTFEVGGKQKTGRQIEGIPNSYLALDGLEYGHGNKVPLWQFGFLY